MKKRFSLLLLTLTLAATAFAIPAKRGLYKMITLTDGTTVSAQLMGDEHKSWWQTDDGRTFTLSADNETFMQVNVEDLPYQLPVNDTAVKPEGAPMMKLAGEQPSEPIVGERKGLIVLVQFPDCAFQEKHTPAYYENVANGLNFTNEDGYVGSVRDYFRDQSNGQLDYTFDIVGPITLSKEHDYYGKEGTNQHDLHMADFVKEAYLAIKADVDFSKYDNDGDDEVDNIFFIYAGNGQADSNVPNCIWPHMYYFPQLGLSYTANGKHLNVYACAAELQGSGRIAGIGAICHEFSHCLGLPDLYSTGTSETYGGNYWTLMHKGAYLGDQFRPCGYTAYERMFVGWMELEELEEEQTVIDAPGLSEGGKAYKMTNNNYIREYYIVEPRVQTGWDTCLPASGLLLWHIDYLKSVWKDNTVNNDPKHQRCFVVCADNNESDSSIKNDVFPYAGNNYFTDETTPGATLFNANTDGKKFLHRSLYDIRLNKENSRPSFSFMQGTYQYKNEDTPEGALFYEGFERCAGTGGNDGKFGNGITTAVFVPDHLDWTYNTAYGGDACARFGTATKDGYAVTPEFEVTDKAELSFLAAPFNNDPAQVELEIASGTATFDNSVFPTQKGKWTTCSTLINGSGKIQIKFKGYSRFLLDEVVVMPAGSGIENIELSVPENDVYFNLFGQRVNSAARGILIHNGQKVIR